MKVMLALSLFLFPFISLARAPRTSLPIEKNATPQSLSSQRAFKTPEIQVESSVCGPACLSSAEKSLDREAIKALNRVPTEHAEAIGAVLQNIPVISASLKKEGLSSSKAQSSNKALIAAITQSARENWEPETQANVVTFAQALALDPVANQKKLNEVRENCRL